MKPFRKILVPTDFSSFSRQAVLYAADLSKKYNAALTIVHVYQPMNYAFPEGFVLFTPAQMEEILNEFTKQLAATKQEAEQAGALGVTTTTLQGIAHSEIVAYAKDGNYDLIVMGTHGRTGLKHVLMGSVAEKVVRKAHCPVLSVRGESEGTEDTKQ